MVGTRPRILVVEDDATLRRFIATLLVEEGYAVRTAANGQEALNHLDDAMPQLVLSDLQMPVMDGWAQCAQLFTRAPSLPMVLMSAGANPRLEAARSGAAGWLTKPFDLDDLLTVIQRLVGVPPAADGNS